MSKVPRKLWWPVGPPLFKIWWPVGPPLFKIWWSGGKSGGLGPQDHR